MRVNQKSRLSVIAGALSAIFSSPAAVLMAVGFSSPALAINTTWFGGAGDWTVGGNWDNGQPGAGDVAIINAGTATLGFDTSILGLTQGGGTVSGTGNLTLTGGSTWSAGTHTGTGSTTFDSTLAISGVATKAISGNRILNLTDTTTWSGNTGNNNNAIQFATGTLNNNGTFNDQNAFGSFLDHSSGTNAFNNVGTYNKQSNTITTAEVVFNNSGTINVNAGSMLMSASTHTGTINLGAGASVEFRNGTNVLDNATTSGAGTLIVSTDNVGADGIVTINGGTLNSAFLLSGGSIRGTDQVFQGAATWTGGAITGAASTTFASTLAISGPNTKTISGGRTVNAGNTTWSGNTGSNNTIALASTSVFNNTGTFTDSNTFNSAITGGGATFNNSGTFNKQSNTTTAVGVAFNNTGTVNVNAGTFLPGGGGTSTGVFNIAENAKLEFRNGNHTLNNVTTSGAGTFQVSTENVGADAIVTLNGGTHTTPVLLSGSILAGTDHTFQGAATWTGGTITGAASTTFANTLSITGATGKTISGGRTVNAGNTTWSGNTGNNNNAIGLSGASIFNNTGTFTDSNAFDSAINVGGGGATFNNSGTFNKQSNTTTAVGVAFNNTGTVNVNAGTFLPGGGGTSTGVFNIAENAKLEFRNGNHTLNNVTTSGAGTFQVSTENVGADAIVTLNGGTHTTPLLLSGSTLTGTDHVFQGPVTWTGGAISGTASTTAFDSTTFSNNVTISGANLKTLVGGRTLNLEETTTWSGNTANNNNAIRFWNGATLNNNGTFNDENAFNSFIEHNVGGPHNFNNVGTYNKTMNTVTLFDLGVTLNNPGTFNVNAGTVQVSSALTNNGLINAAAGATLLGSNATFVNAGTLTGDGTIATHANGDIVNQGAIHPGSAVGHITLDGDLTQAAAGVLNFELASLAGFDTLGVTDDVTLDGSIVAWNAGYVPVIGDSFVVMTFDELLGASEFDAVTTHGYGPGVMFEALYNLHDVTLTVVAVPEPEAWVMLLTGLGFVGFAMRRRTTA